MKNSRKKIAAAVISLSLCFALIAGCVEIVEMMGGPSVAVPVLASGGDDTSSTPTYETPVVVTPSKSANPISVKTKTVKIDGAKVAKKTQTVAKAKAFTIKKAQGSVRFTKKSGNKKITINKKSGKITIKKGLKPGKYNLSVTVTAYGNSSYKAGSRTVTVKINVSKISNTMTVSGETIDFTSEQLAASSITIKRADAITIERSVGKLSFVKKSGDARITVNKKTGNITVAQGITPGSYNVKVAVTAAGNAKSKKTTKNATVNIVVAEPEPAADGSTDSAAA